MKALEYIKQNYWLLAILTGASALRLFHLDFQSVWMDEIYTLNVSDPSLTFKQMHDEVVLREGFPYLYFILLRFFYAVLGYTEIVARLLSVVGGIAGVGAIYVFGKHIFNKQAGLIAAFLLAINDFHIAASQEARPYTLFVLFAIIAFYRLSVFIKEQSLKNAIWFGLAAGLMLNINFFALLTLFAQGLVLLFVIAFSEKENRLMLFFRSVLAGAIAILLFLPNYEIFLKLMNFQSFWVPAPQADSYTLMFREFLGNSEITWIIFMIILFCYAVNVFKENEVYLNVRALLGNPINYSFAILFFWFMGYFGLLYAKSYFGTSVVLSRYFITMVPVILLMLAMGIYFIRNRVAQSAIILAILYFSLANLIIAKEYYTKVSKSQYREVSNYIKENNTPAAPVYTSLKYWYAYFLQKGENQQQLTELPLENLVRQMMQRPDMIKPFWYADAHVRPYSLSTEAQEFIDNNFVLSDNFEGFDAWTRYYEPKTASNTAIDTGKFGKLKHKNGTQFNHNLEVFDQTGNQLKASGWAYFEGNDASATKISLVLVKDDEAIKLPVLMLQRLDVNTHFKLDYNAANSGFSMQYNLDTLKPGQYMLGIYLVNKKLNKEGLLITDKVVKIL